MSRISCVTPDAYALVSPSKFCRIAMFDVIAPSNAFNVEASGWFWPSGHSVRYPKGPCGTTVTLNTYASAVLGTPQELSTTSTAGLISPLNAPPDRRVSSTRQGAAGYSDSPPGPAGAK